MQKTLFGIQGKMRAGVWKGCIWYPNEVIKMEETKQKRKRGRPKKDNKLEKFKRYLEIKDEYETLKKELSLEFK